MPLSLVEMEARLRAFYATHNPGNDQNIDEIVQKYQGKEAALCARLKKKYGVAPDLLEATGDDANKTPSSSSSSMDPVLPTAARSTPRVVAAAVAYDADYQIIRAVATTTNGDPNPLDFRSSVFNALQALHARVLEPPVKGITPFDNIHKCRHLLPPSDSNYQKLVIATKKATTTTSKKNDDHAISKETKDPSQRLPALFEELAETYVDGPFTVLRRCFLERKRVRVVIRRVNSVRGTCSGFLKAFDKHMNMVLLDVQEEWIPHPIYMVQDRLQAEHKKQNASQPERQLFSVADPHLNRSFTVKSYAKQVFVRGDNVVMAMEDGTARRDDNGGASSDRYRGRGRGRGRPTASQPVRQSDSDKATMDRGNESFR